MLPHLLMLIAFYIAFFNAADGGKSNHLLITEALMTDYDRIGLPVINMSEPLRVRLNLQLLSIIEVDIAQQTLTLKQWLNMYWNDPNLSWNPELFGGLATVMLQRSTIWLPDIVIVDQTMVSQLPDNLSIAQVTSDGNVSISSDQVVTITCEYDVSYFPYDTQNCSLRFSSWMYPASGIDPYATEPTDMTVYNENDEWILRSFTTRKQISVTEGDTYVDLYYDIKITRKPNYYISAFFWPSFIITCLAIVGIFSPFNEAGEREERLTMGLTTLLTMAVILMIIADQMPKSSKGLPLMGIFILFEIGISSVASLMSVLVIYTHSNWMNGTPVPNWLKKLTWMTTKKRQQYNVSDSKEAWQHKETPAHASKSDSKLLVMVKNDAEMLTLNINIADMRDESLRHQWSKATHRLDLILMITFLIINVVISMIVLVIGNNHMT